MSKQKLILLVSALLLMGGASGLLVRLKANQRLGPPGVKTALIEGSRNEKVVLPELVLDYTSEELQQDGIVTNTLPRDTSFGQRRYVAADGFWLQMNVVLMGADRTSIHKPQYCLEGAGWQIDHAATLETKVRIERPQPYDLPVIKIVSSRQFSDANGRPVTYRGVYVYWYVADGLLSGDKSGRERMWWMARDLLRTGVLQRWAYASCFVACVPGQEDAAFDRVKKFMAAAVPQFQLTPKAGGGGPAGKP